MRGGHCTLGLLYANSQISPESFIRPEMKRLAPESMAVAQGALMPTGAVAALLYDKELKEYRAVEAPLAVAAGHTADLHLKPPGQGSSDLVVVLLRPKVIAQTTEEEAMPRLVLASGKGRYRIVLARPRGYVVMVQFPDRGRPYLVIIDVQGTGRPDLEVPGNDFRVRVVRGDTGAPIPKADVGVNNETGRVRAQEAGGGAGAPDHIVGAYTRQSNQPSSTSEPPSHSPAP